METAIKSVNKIVEFNEFETKLLDFKKNYDNIIYDLTIPSEEKKARSDRLTIGKVIARLDEKHKEIKAPLKKKVDLIDGERKRIKDDLLLVQEKIKSQIAEHDRKIAEREAAEKKLVDDIYLLANYEYQPSSEEIKSFIDHVESIDIEDEKYSSVKAQAALAVVETLRKLKSAYETQEQYENEQAELERLRKEKEEQERKEREYQIAKEAEEKAKADAKAAIEAAEKSRIAAEEKAKQDLIDAENRRIQSIKEAEERAARQAEEKRLAEEKAAKQREADKAHKAKINNAALAKIMEIGISEEHGKKLITAIHKGKVPNVSIHY